MSAKVYVMQGLDALKIGFSHSPEARRAQLRRDGAVKVLRTYDVSDARSVEAAAHHLLAEKRKRGEWFDVSVEEAESAIEAAVRMVDSGEWAALRPEGAKSTSIYLTDAERDLWDRIATERNVTKKDALLAGLRALDRADAEPTPEQALEILARMVRKSENA